LPGSAPDSIGCGKQFSRFWTQTLGDATHHC